MSPDQLSVNPDTAAINRGFSRQSFGYDNADRNNIILQDLRLQVYRHVEHFLEPQSKILELNAGTGIDALHFVSHGHYVHATDLSDGMISQIKRKIASNDISDRLTCQQLSFEELSEITQADFDYVFSNFGGLNCAPDLSKITRHLPGLLKPGAYVTWVIMPPVCPWELMGMFKGRQAFRRLKKGGVVAHVEDEYFRTYYHSVNSIVSAFGDGFTLVKCEGLAALSPPPHRADLPLKRPGLYKVLRALDGVVKNIFPFNRWADHVVVTMRYGSSRSMPSPSIPSP